MPITTIYPTSISFTSNAANVIGPYQAADDTWSIAPGTGKLEIGLRFTPPANPTDGADQFIEYKMRKALSGGSATLRVNLHIWEDGSSVENNLDRNITIPDEDISSSFEWTDDYAVDGLTMEVVWEQNTGYSGGSSSNWTWPEFDYVRWVCDHATPTGNPVVEQIAMVAFSLDGKGVSFTIPMLVIPGVTTIGLIGKGVVGVIPVVETVVSTSVSLVGKAANGVVEVVSVIGATSMALAGKAVTSATDLVSTVVAASMALTTQAVTSVSDLVSAPAAASVAVVGKAVTFVLNLLSTPASATIVNSGQSVVTAVDLVSIVTSAAISVTGKAVLSSVGAIISVGAGSMALVGQGVTAVAETLVIIGKASFALTGKAVSDGADAIASVGAASMGLVARSVTTTTNLVTGITAASLGLSGRSVFANLAERIGKASFALTGRSVSASVALIEQVAMQSITTSTLQAYFAVNTRAEVDAGGIALSGKAVIIPAPNTALVGVATMLLFAHNVTIIATDPSTNTGLIRKISLPGVYTELWKYLVRADTVERL